jgi:hypothetical protein
MSDIDRVFARLGGGQSAASEQRELRSIPRRGGVTGSRVVEVVRLPATGMTARKGQAGRSDVKVRAQTWEGGFPTRAAPAQSPLQEPVAAEKIEPVAHVMPVRQPAVVQPEPTPPHAPPDAAQAAEPRPARRARPTARRIADPFDETDDGANCFRCGYLIEPARERRGLMTCAECG